MVAEGFSVDVALQAEVAEPGRCSWTERRWLVRSVAFAAGQHQQLERRCRRPQEQLEQARPHASKGRDGWVPRSCAAAQAIVQKQRVEGLLDVQVETTTRER